MEYQESFGTSKVDKAQLFKQKHGRSLTMDKLMKKHGCKTVEEYRAIRKENKKAIKAAEQPKATKKSSAPIPSSQKKKR